MPRPRKGDNCNPLSRSALRWRSARPIWAARRRSATSSGSSATTPCNALRVLISGQRHALDQALDHAVAVDAFGLGLERQQHAMAQDVQRDRVQILRRDVVATGEPGVGAGAAL